MPRPFVLEARGFDDGAYRGTAMTGTLLPHIRRIRSDEGPKLRALRLHALAEAPTAFGSTLAVEQAFSDAVWRERAIGASLGEMEVICLFLPPDA